jgi:hypothetical protein
MARFNIFIRQQDGKEFVRYDQEGKDAQHAMQRVEDEYNKPLWVGEKSAARRVADNDGYYIQDGPFLVPQRKVYAFRAEVCKGAYVACAAWSISTGEFIDRI